MRHISDDERRARLALRHGLAPATRFADPETATRGMTVLHSTEAPSVYLSLLARVQDLTVADVDRALYDERTIVKQLAMRRTLFVFPRELLPAAWGSTSARVAAQLRARLVKEIEAAGLAEDGAAWLERASAATLAHLADGKELPAAALREAVPELTGRVELAPGKPYGGQFPIAPRVLTQLGVEGLITRGRNAGHWRISRPQWTAMSTWLGEVEEPWKADEGWAELVRRWLSTFGPGTSADLQWWLGATAGIVKQALAEVGAEQVTVDRDQVGWVAPGDTDTPAYDEPWAALLPVLDPTVMGWKQRDFYLDPRHVPHLFDSNGNAGTTAWWNGRIVGCWVQDEAGVVAVRPLERLPTSATRALEVEAERLTAWLGGVRIGTVYPSAGMKG